ncbi:MAG: hypothetical protein KA004_07840 [Verrucomicrobiales bacterium]|nr:hypothetical protein [Verrucomicrobiales bacterium]
MESSVRHRGLTEALVLTDGGFRDFDSGLPASPVAGRQTADGRKRGRVRVSNARDRQ